MNRFLKNIKRKIMRVPEYINNLMLCIRFPFLYPKNAFDNNHFQWYWLLTQISKLEIASFVPVNIRVVTPGDSAYNKIDPNIKYINYANQKYKLTYRGRFLLDISTINKDGSFTNYTTIDIRDYINGRVPEDKELYAGFEASFLTNYYFNDLKTYNLNIIFPEGVNVNYTAPNKCELIFCRWKYLLALLLQWFHNTVLQWIMFIPGYTHLDSLPKGWRKIIGIQLCKELKAQIINEFGWKHLFKYKVLQVKEKYGSLRWYDSNTSSAILDIIDKYEDLSYNTCCNCGKPATKLSKGWICPYCDDCVQLNKQYIDLKTSKLKDNE